DYEILVVDDGSTDKTLAEVQAQRDADPRVRLLVNDGPHGFGYAVRFGLDRFEGDAVVIVMADGSDEPDDIIAYYDILKNKAECAFGSRWVTGARVSGYPRFKFVVNRFSNLLIRLLFGLKYNDVTNALRVIGVMLSTV